MFQLAPSLLAADFWNLERQITTVVDAGATVLHVDVMDGHFVPNLTMGPCVVSSLRKKTDAILDVHLMVKDPDFFVDPFADAGADWISFHVEAGGHPHRTCQKIRDRGCKAGVVINPGTPIAFLDALLEEVDFVLLMSVNPGFGGQAFIEKTYNRLQRLRARIQKCENKPFIQVDGGIVAGNIADLRRAGMDVAVAGSSVFRKPDPAAAVRKLIQLAEDADER